MISGMENRLFPGQERRCITAQRQMTLPLLLSSLQREATKTHLADSAASMYKVPALRNVAPGAPYFHTGNLAELSDAVRVMGSVQSGRVLSSQDVSLLPASVESLTGDVYRSVPSDESMTAMEQISR